MGKPFTRAFIFITHLANSTIGDKLMAFIGPVEDRIAIRELIDTYNDAVNCFDETAWAKTWASDAEWHLPGNVISGKSAIVKMWKTAMESFDYVGFFAAPGMINVDGDKASLRTHVRETLVPSGQQAQHLEGLYNDQLVRIDGQWHFQQRIYTIVYRHNSA